MMKSFTSVTIMLIVVSTLFTACSQPRVQPDETTPIPVAEATKPVTISSPSLEVNATPVAVTPPGPSKVEQLLSTLNTRQERLALALDHELFDSKNKADLLPTALRDLAKIAEFLRNHPQWRAEIVNYPDHFNDYHWGLSERQTNAIRFALIQQGIASNRIIARGLAENNFSSGGRSRPIEITMTLNNASQRYE